MALCIAGPRSLRLQFAVNTTEPFAKKGHAMSYKTILVHIDNGKRCKARLDVAIQMARRSDAHLVGLNALTALRLPAYAAAESILAATSAKVFREFAELVERAAERTGVEHHRAPQLGDRPEVREVLFLDTGDFHLYNHAFIVRRRISYEDGFPVGDPEIVFKYRTTDMKAAQALDVRPRVSGRYKIKFKLEILPLKERLGGIRRLLAHNVEFGLSQAPEAERLAMMRPRLPSTMVANASARACASGVPLASAVP